MALGKKWKQRKTKPVRINLLFSGVASDKQFSLFYIQLFLIFCERVKNLQKLLVSKIRIGDWLKIQ